MNNEEKTETILVRCTKTLKAEVIKAAKKENRSMTNFVETLLIEKVMKNEDQGFANFNSDTNLDSGQELKKETVLSKMKHNF